MPQAPTIRLRRKSHDALKELASITGQSMQDVLDQAIEDCRRKVYLQGLNDDYARLKKNRRATADLKKELALWDKTNLDGVED